MTNGVRSKNLRITIGTAGWSISRDLADRFAAQGSSLERYASVFGGVEVNSSFYRRHRKDTWQRWHDAVPADFRFAVKVPKLITHDLRLAETAGELDIFLQDIVPLGHKLGPLLVQLPPSLAFDEQRDATFLAELRDRNPGRILIEPRHPSWASPQAGAVLAAFGVGRVYADPEQPALRQVVGVTGFVYLRLHGAPKVYYSPYSATELDGFQQLLSGAADGSWCIFDNTASGAALGNALHMQALQAPA